VSGKDARDFVKRGYYLVRIIPGPIIRRYACLKTEIGAALF
jgi:hypothetical protein